MASTQGTVTTSDLRDNPKQVLQRIIESNEHLIVEHNAFRVAMLIPYDDYLRMIEMAEALSVQGALWARLEKEIGTTLDELRAGKS